MEIKYIMYIEFRVFSIITLFIARVGISFHNATLFLLKRLNEVHEWRWS